MSAHGSAMPVFSLLVVSILTLFISVGTLLLSLWRTWLWWPVGPILLTLALRVVGILSGASLRWTIALLLTGVALLSRILLLGWVALLLRGTLLVGFLLLAILRTSFRSSLAAMTILVPIILLLAWILLRGTLLRWPVRGHGSLAHDVVALVHLAHHAHGSLLALVVLSTTTRGHIVLLGRRLLVHHRTLIGLHVHVGSWAVVSHWLALAHVHLALSGHTL